MKLPRRFHLRGRNSRMPAISDIKISIENKNIFVKDEFIKQGEFVRNNNGSLQLYAGGFTAVFPVIVNGKKWAFRCWHSELGNVKRRFSKISDFIKSVNVPYLCDFEYVDEGIIVNGKIYPTTRMRWIDGVTIKEYICSYADDKPKMLALAANFLSLIRDMHQHHLAHGDLQHGNLIIDKEGNIFLVDYDSFYCPTLTGESDIITGLADYQHPARKDNAITSEKLDYFSELVIYTSILAIAENPSLIKKYQVADSERMLFSAKDYQDFTDSEIYKDLQNLTPEIKQLLSIFIAYLSETSILNLDSFDVILDRMNIRFSISKSKIREGKEESILSWEVKDATHIAIYEGKTLLHDNLQEHGELSVAPSSTTTYILEVVGSTGKKSNKECTLFVYKEADVSFSSDKEYVFPSVPFTLTWNVKNAKHVSLDGETVEAEGHKEITNGVRKATSFVLEVTDEFETQQHSIEIKMLPIPQIKSLLVPTPKVGATTINVKATIPSPIVNVNFPQPELHSVELLHPEIYDLKVETNAAKLPQVVAPVFSLRTPNLWDRAKSQISKIFRNYGK